MIKLFKIKLVFKFQFKIQFNTFLEPNSQYDVAQTVGPSARASAPKARTVPIRRPFCDLLPNLDIAEVSEGMTEAAAKAKGIRPR